MRAALQQSALLLVAVARMALLLAAPLSALLPALVWVVVQAVAQMPMAVATTPTTATNQPAASVTPRLPVTPPPPPAARTARTSP